MMRSCAEMLEAVRAAFPRPNVEYVYALFPDEKSVRNGAAPAAFDVALQPHTIAPGLEIVAKECLQAAAALRDLDGQ